MKINVYMCWITFCMHNAYKLKRELAMLQLIVIDPLVLIPYQCKFSDITQTKEVNVNVCVVIRHVDFITLGTQFCNLLNKTKLFYVLVQPL